MLNIAKTARKNEGEVYTFSEKRKNVKIPEKHEVFGAFVENIFHRGFSLITGISGKGSIIGTKKLLEEIDKISPDVVHLHNLHGWYINIPMLFNYIKHKQIKTIWTLHDCWAFTAQCSHFTIEKCEKWKTGCYKCPRYKLYPYTWVDRTKKMYKLKKKWFTGVQDMTLVTPSKWLADLVKQSFLKDYPVQVINNGIDLSVFKPTESDFREKYGLENKFILLGVAFGWGIRKGLDVFLELSKRLDERFQIVLVGTDENVDKQLPNNIISIHRTQNQQELAEIYTAADLFVNPTREEVLGLVNIEALACGTPVITFNTGGSPEVIDENCGIVVEKNDTKNLEQEVLRIEKERPFSIDACINRAKNFSADEKFAEYIDLYKEKVK